jgi:VIT1/CCC1 family predicted Fe2+/Mn2+ transporter
VNKDPQEANQIIRTTVDSYGLSEDVLDAFATQISSCPKRSESFIMRFHHDLPESQADASRAYISALTIAIGYLLGGLVPLTPYFFVSNNQTALYWSMGIMAFALFVFGYIKTLLVGEKKRLPCVKAGVEMMVLGGVAAGAAMGCVKAIGS